VDAYLAIKAPTAQNTKALVGRIKGSSMSVQHSLAATLNLCGAFTVFPVILE